MGKNQERSKDRRNITSKLNIGKATKRRWRYV